jgi:hypothetical protein
VCANCLEKLYVWNSNNLCIELKDGNSADWTPFLGGRCEGNSHLLGWTSDSTLMHLASKKCLQAYQNGEIGLYKCEAGANQQWDWKPPLLVSKASGSVWTWTAQLQEAN